MTPADLAIRFETRHGGGRWVAETKEGPPSEMEFVVRADGAWTITHTGVPSALEGRGIAAALLQRAIHDAREAGVKIDPQCSYVAAAFKRKPELQELKAE